MIIVYIIFLVKQNGLPFALEKVRDWVNLLLENQELLSGRSSLMHDTLDIFGQPYLWRNQTLKQRTVVRNVVESGCSILKQRKCWTSPFDWNRMSLRHFQKRTSMDRGAIRTDIWSWTCPESSSKNCESEGFLIIGKYKKCENELYAVKFG